MDPTIEYFDQRDVCVKLEAVAGTDPVINPAVDGFRFYDGSCDTEFQKIEKKADRRFWGGHSFRTANRRAWIEGNVDLYPPSAPGVVGPTGSARAERLLLPAAFAVTRDLANKVTRYNPISRAIVAAWSRYYWGGEILNVESGSHVVSAVKMAIDDCFSMKVRLQGTYPPILEAVPPPVPVDETLSVVSTWDNSIALLSTVDGAVEDLNLWCRELSWDSGSDVKTTPWTSKRLTGHTGRMPTAKCILIRPKNSDINLHTVRDANRLINLSYRTYESSTKVGLYSEHGVRMQIDTIKRTNVDGYAAYEIAGPCIPSSAGGDEVYIAFGDDTP